MFEFCKSEISGITTLFIPIERMRLVREQMAERYTVAKTIPGTRSFHCFVPINKFSIGAKRVSEEDGFEITFSFSEENKKTKINVNVSQYMACIYDGLPWIGIVQDKSLEDRDVQVKFMHPHFPSCSYHWPSHDDAGYQMRIF